MGGWEGDRKSHLGSVCSSAKKGCEGETGRGTGQARRIILLRCGGLPDSVATVDTAHLARRPVTRPHPLTGRGLNVARCVATIHRVPLPHQWASWPLSSSSAFPPCNPPLHNGDHSPPTSPEDMCQCPCWGLVQATTRLVQVHGAQAARAQTTMRIPHPPPVCPSTDVGPPANHPVPDTVAPEPRGVSLRGRDFKAPRGGGGRPPSVCCARRRVSAAPPET